MVLLIILISAVVLTWVILIVFDFDDTGAGCIVSFLLALGIFGFTNMVYDSSESVEDNAKRTNVEKVELVALNNSSEYSGTFFLAFGSLDEKDEYKFITRDEEGGMEIDSTRVSNAVVYEIPGATSAYMETAYLKKESTWFAIGATSEDKVRFYVPEGSVQKDFNVALD